MSLFSNKVQIANIYQILTSESHLSNWFLHSFIAFIHASQIVLVTVLWSQSHLFLSPPPLFLQFFPHLFKIPKMSPSKTNWNPNIFHKVQQIKAHGRLIWHCLVSANFLVCFCNTALTSHVIWNKRGIVELILIDFFFLGSSRRHQVLRKCIPQDWSDNITFLVWSSSRISL